MDMAAVAYERTRDPVSCSGRDPPGEETYDCDVISEEHISARRLFAHATAEMQQVIAGAMSHKKSAAAALGPRKPSLKPHSDYGYVEVRICQYRLGLMKRIAVPVLWALVLCMHDEMLQAIVQQRNVHLLCEV